MMLVSLKVDSQGMSRLKRFELSIEDTCIRAREGTKPLSMVGTSELMRTEGEGSLPARRAGLTRFDPVVTIYRPRFLFEKPLLGSTDHIVNLPYFQRMIGESNTRGVMAEFISQCQNLNETGMSRTCIRTAEVVGVRRKFEDAKVKYPRTVNPCQPYEQNKTEQKTRAKYVYVWKSMLSSNLKKDCLL